MNSLKKARGTTGQIETAENKIIIERRGLSSVFRLLGFLDEKELYYDDISSVYFRPAGLLMNGYIRFTTDGSAKPRLGYYNGFFDNKMITFSRSSSSQFEDVIKHISSKDIEIIRKQENYELSSKSSKDTDNSIAENKSLNKAEFKKDLGITEINGFFSELFLSAIGLYVKYLSRSVRDPRTAKILGILLYILFLPISVFLSILIFDLRRLNEHLYADRITKEAYYFIKNDYGRYDNIIQVVLANEYTTRQILGFNSSKEHFILELDEEIKILEASTSFKISILGVNFLLKDLEFKEISSLNINELDVERKEFRGLPTFKLFDNSEQFTLAVEKYPNFVRDKINSNLDIIDLQNFEEKVGGLSWGIGEKDKLAVSLDNLLTSLNSENPKYYLNDSNESQKCFILIDGLHLTKIDIDESDKTVSISESHDITTLKQHEIRNGFNYTSRDRRGFSLKIYFKNNEEKEDFRSDLKKELNKKDIYFYNGYWDTREEIEHIKEMEIGLDNNFQDLTPYEFEELVKNIFQAKGYKARRTKKSSDYGVDVIAEKEGHKIAVQAKRYKESNKVGSPDTRDTLGSIHKINADKALLVTTSWFTSNAKETSRNSPIELWNKSTLHKEVRKNLF